MLLGALAWMIHVSRAKELLQDAVLAVIKTLALALPTRFTLPIGTIENGAVASDEARTWLDEHGIMPVWASKKVYVKMPPLETANIPASWFLVPFEELGQGDLHQGTALCPRCHSRPSPGHRDRPSGPPNLADNEVALVIVGVRKEDQVGIARRG